MQGQYAAPPVLAKMARRDHHRAQPAGPSAATETAGVRADQGRRVGRPQGAAERNRRRADECGASELHGAAGLRVLASEHTIRQCCASIPQAILSRVVFPAPLGPTRLTTCAGPYTFVWIDALCQKIGEGGRTVNVHAMIATWANADGRREILGLE
jgi:hypothetical protein